MTEQIQSVASIDDFEANRAKTKKALPALLIVSLWNTDDSGIQSGVPKHW